MSLDVLLTLPEFKHSARIRKWLDVVTVDKDGYITFDELSKFLSYIPRDTVAKPDDDALAFVLKLVSDERPRASTHRDYVVCMLAKPFEVLPDSTVIHFLKFCEYALSLRPLGQGRFRFPRSQPVTGERVESVRKYLQSVFEDQPFEVCLHQILEARCRVKCEDKVKDSEVCATRLVCLIPCFVMFFV